MFGPDQDIRVVIAHRDLHATDLPYAALQVQWIHRRTSCCECAANELLLGQSLAMARSMSALAAASPIFTFTITVRRSGRTIAGGSDRPASLTTCRSMSAAGALVILNCFVAYGATPL